MDYTIAPGVTAIGSGDAAPVSGTKGEFTSGNPSTSTPATVLPGYQMNAIVEELLNVITAAGLTPNNTNNAQLLAALPIVGTGRLLNVQTFTTSGTSTYTPTAGTTSIEVEVQGGGAAGGGCSSTGASQTGGGSGGSAGGWAMKRITSGFTGATITVGAGGASVTAGTGGAGGTSSFGAFVSATGGNGGGQIGPGTPPNAPSGGTAGGTASGGDVNTVGGHGNFAWFGTAFLGGKGGMSHYGEGGFQTSGTSGGNPGQSPGSGGSGCALAASSGTNAAGGAGKAGLVRIREYS